MRLRAPAECVVQKSRAACTWGNYVSNLGKLGKWRSSAFAGEHFGGQSDPRMPPRATSGQALGGAGLARVRQKGLRARKRYGCRAGALPGGGAGGCFCFPITGCFVTLSTVFGWVCLARVDCVCFGLDLVGFGWVCLVLVGCAWLGLIVFVLG